MAERVKVEEVIRTYGKYISKGCGRGGDPYMDEKVTTSVRISKMLKDLADELGMNLSAFLELKLFEHFRELILLKENQNMVLRPGFEPGSRDRELSFSPSAALDYSKHRDEFIQWVSRNRLPKTWRRYVQYLDEVLGDRTIFSPAQLSRRLADYERETGKKVDRHKIIAIRNYLNFLVETGKARKSQVVDYYPVLKLEKTNLRDPKKAFTTEEKIIQAHEHLKERGDRARLLLFYLMLFGGLRLTEACDILNNFNREELEFKDNFARYDMLSMYKRINSTKARASQTKRAWYAYMPVWVAEQLQPMQVNEEILRGKHFCNGIILPNMLRKWFSNFLKDCGVEERVIEFITGKTPERILRQFYFELLRDADQAYSQVVGRIEEVIRGD